MKRMRADLPMLIAAAAIASLAVAGCGTATAGADSHPAETASHSAFVGHTWQVVTITRDGKQTPIPPSYDLYLSFARSGQFGANDPFNYHSGTYRTTGDGFTTSQLIVSAVGSAGDNPLITLAIDAIHAFDNGVSAQATVSGDRLAVTADGYQFGCRRDG